jgi:hypothetical protein
VRFQHEQLAAQLMRDHHPVQHRDRDRESWHSRLTHPLPGVRWAWARAREVSGARAR